MHCDHNKKHLIDAEALRTIAKRPPPPQVSALVDCPVCNGEGKYPFGHSGGRWSICKNCGGPGRVSKTSIKAFQVASQRSERQERAIVYAILAAICLGAIILVVGLFS